MRFSDCDSNTHTLKSSFVSSRCMHGWDDKSRCSHATSGLLATHKRLPYFPAYSTHLTYNAHPKLFCIPFEVQLMHTTFVTLCMYLCMDHLVICDHRSVIQWTVVNWRTVPWLFLCPLVLKDNLGGLHHSLVTSCLKGRCTFFVFNL
jgi:hypothetical protein